MNIVNDIKNLSRFPKFLLGVVRWGTYSTLATPLIMHPVFVFPFLVPKTIVFWVVSEIVGVAWLLLAISNPRFRPRWNWVFFSIALYLGIMVITSLTGINPERSFWSTFARMSGTVQWTHLVLFFFAIAATNKALNDWIKIFSVSAGIASFVSVLFLVEKIKPFIGDTQDGSTVGNSSFFAAYILFNIFIGIWFTIKTRGHASRIFYGISTLSMVFALALADAFGALFSFAGGIFLLFVAWLFFTHKNRIIRTTAVALLACGIIVGAGASIAIISQNDQAISLLSTLTPKDGLKFTLGTRVITWGSALRAIKEKPLLGWGPENYNVAATTYFDPRLARQEPLNGSYWFDRPHNIILEVLVHSGVLGLAGYISLFVSALYILWRKVLRRKEGVSKNWFTPSIFTIVLAMYLIQNLLIFDTTSSLLMFVVVLAFIAGTAKIDRGESASTTLHNPSVQNVAILGALLISSIVIFGVRPLEAAYWSNRVVKTSKDLTKQLIFYDKALSLSPIGNRETLDFILDSTVEMLDNQEIISRVYITKLGDAMTMLEKKNPRDLRHPLQLSKLFMASARLYPEYFKKAEAAAKRAIELSPANQQGYTFLAHVYLKMGEKEKAFEQLENAIRLDPTFIRAHLNLIEGYVLTGEMERAYKKADKLKEMEPNILEMIKKYSPKKKSY